MTRMLPDRLSGDVTASEAEAFHLIREAAGSDDYICLHSVGIARHQRKEYAEADFVLIGPPGVYCLEVKGGEVRRKNGIWEIGWPGRSYESIEGPFKQAQGTRWPLLAYLSARLGRDLRSDTQFGWGVVFPDIIFERVDPEWDAAVVYDQRDKAVSFVFYAERLEAYHLARSKDTGRRPTRRLGPARVNEIANCLRGDFEVVPSLTGLIAESGRELARLSPDQYKILDFALNESNPRIICDGGAGTGKTLIALEAARRFARRGLSVLLVCFNDNLSRFLKLDASDNAQRISVTTIYALLGDIIRSGGLAQELAAARSSSSHDALFTEVYPNLFERACAALLDQNELPQFDVVIVDEAQDVLSEPLMNCLDLLLHRGFAGGRWMVLLDSGLQSGIYGRTDEAMIGALKKLGAASFALRENFRNPKNVVSETCLLTGAAAPDCKRTIVSSVDYRVYSDVQDQARKLRALLVDLIRQGVAPGSITILSSKPPSEACAASIAKDFGQQIHRLEAASGAVPSNAITSASISAFKGLENEVVILTDIPAIAPMSEWTRSILYVGMTRARSKLYALVDRNFLAAREGQ